MTYSVDIADFTTAVETDSDVTGTGVFDVMMNSIRANVYEEYREGRITGAEYAQVYLSAMNSAADRALSFVLQQHKVDLEAQKIVAEIEVLTDTACKLKQEFEVLEQQELKVIAETGLVGQKTATEAAQISGTNVDANSVIGRQKELYFAQGEAFIRDGEQKATKIMVDTWNVRKTTDETTDTTDTNLSNPDIGLAVAKLMAGIGVTT